MVASDTDTVSSDGRNLPEPTAEQATAFAASSNAFAVDLWARLRQREGNLAVSPASVSMALAMTYAGARSQTATEMAAVMHFGDDTQALHEGAGRLLAAWNDPAPRAYTLRVVNRLFGETAYEIQESFQALTRERYGAPLESLQFRASPDAARRHINAWVEQQTEARIRELLPPTSIGPETRLVLTNAVYFLGRWEQPFRSNATREGTFHRVGAESVQVPFMSQTTRFPYAEDEDVQVVQMGYDGGDFAMVLVVPKEREGLAAVEQALGVDRIERWVAALTPEMVSVRLPKFEIDPPASIALAETLQQMGMRQAFSSGVADFTGIADPPNPNDRLSISNVFHKAFVRVDEEGTEAAAATAVATGRGVPPAPSRQVEVDRPFLFLVRDVRQGTILFLGRVADPSANAG